MNDERLRYRVGCEEAETTWQQRSAKLLGRLVVKSIEMNRKTGSTYVKI